MSDLLSIGSSGVAAYQRALSTVSNNIANVGTEGYVRQETALAENMPRQQGTIYIGTGSSVAGIRRAYDQFLEQNLRNTTSELNTQGPLVEYANRVVDLMGSESVGLTGSLNEFFSSARSLSADPASTILRSQFLSKADGLASRFRELSTQIGSVDAETREAIGAKVDNINTLAGQLAAVNKQLSRKPTADRQPPDLLDQRDLLLTRLSALAKVSVTTAANGSVQVGLGNQQGTGIIVDGEKAVPLQVRFDERDLSKVSIIADPYGKQPREITGLSSGEVGGLLAFREQVLQPSSDALDSLATSFAKEVNAIHGNGIDASGDVGQDLFRIQKVAVTDKASGKTIEIDRPAAGLYLNLRDQSKVAAGSLFRVIERDTNLSGADAVLSYAPTWAAKVPSLSAVLKNNPNPSAGIAPPKGQLLGQVPIGATDWSLFLDNASGDQQLQVFTRDGRQLAGGKLSKAQQDLLLTTDNGFNPGTTYSADYLNKSGSATYKQIGLFYGQLARPGIRYDSGTQFSRTNAPVPTSMLTTVKTGSPVPAGIEAIPAGRLTINGKTLPGLTPRAPATTVQASDLAAWLNAATDGLQPAVTASGSNRVVLNMTNADAARGITINGAVFAGTPNLAALASAINNEFRAQVHAEVNDPANPTALVLVNADGYAGNDITADGRTFKGTLQLSSDGDIAVGYGVDGKLGDLALLGRPVGNYYTEVYATVPYQASLSGTPIPSGIDKIAAGALTLNGKAIAGLDLGRTLQASDYAAWLNPAGAMMQPPVTAYATNRVSIAAARLTEQALEARSPSSLTLNGVAISGNFKSALDIAQAINAATTGRVTIDTSRLGPGTSLTVNGQRVAYPFSQAAFANVAGLDLQASTLGGAGPIVLVGTGNGDVQVTAQSDDNALRLLTVPKGGLDLGKTLALNGVAIGGPFASARQMIDAINASASGVKATASFDQNGELSSDIRLSGAVSADVEGSALGSSRAGTVVPNGFVIRSAQFDGAKPLVINGVRLTGTGPGGSFTGAADLVAAINGSIGTNAFAKIDGNGNIELQTDMPGGIAIGTDVTLDVVQVTSAVGAAVDSAGNLVLSNGTGGDIRIGTTAGSNLLGIGNGTYKGSLTLASDAEIRMGFGSDGTPAQMAALGLRSGVYLDGAAPEDLLVFATGEGGGTISAGYDATMADPATLNAKRIAQLRSETYEVKFTSDSRYQITWTNPANRRVTVLAERDYDPAAGIQYQGVTLKLDRAPKAGDSFTIDGNQDGTGNNQNINDLIALEKKGVMGGGAGMTIAQAYEQQVGNVGNIASQAAIAKSALKVVNDQATAARDKVSGVSLDNEAADLIRYQQAYQAAAKTIQVASELFDAILSAAR